MVFWERGRWAGVIACAYQDFVCRKPPLCKGRCHGCSRGGGVDNPSVSLTADSSLCTREPMSPLIRHFLTKMPPSPKGKAWAIFDRLSTSVRALCFLLSPNHSKSGQLFVGRFSFSPGRSPAGGWGRNRRGGTGCGGTFRRGRRWRTGSPCRERRSRRPESSWPPDAAAGQW